MGMGNAAHHLGRDPAQRAAAGDRARPRWWWRGAILFESAVSFLGLGDPNVASWGRLVGDGRQLIRSSWYICAIPGVAIMVTVLCLNLIGDGLNDALNPKLRDRLMTSGALLMTARSARPAATTLFTRRGEMKAVDGLSARRSAPARRWRWSANRAAASRCRRCRIMRLLPDPPARIVGGAVMLNGRDLVAPARGGDARHPRQGDRHDLPGPDELAQSGGHGREADRRGADDPHRPRPRPGARAARTSCSSWSACPTPAGGSTPIRTSSRAACASA